MANSLNRLQTFHVLIFTLACIGCIDAKLNVNNHLNPFNFEQIKSALFSQSDFFEPDQLDDFNSKNRTAHRQCWLELNAIKSGLKNFEPWAIQCNPFSNI